MAASAASSSSSSAPAASSSASSAKAPLICGGHSRPVPHLSFSPVTVDGFFLVSACLDGKPMLRNGATGDWIGTFLGHKGAVWAASLNAQATLAATGSADYTCKIWDALSGDCKQTLEHKRIIKTVDFSRDSNRVLTGGQEKQLRVWDLQRPGESVVVGTHGESIKSALFVSEQLCVSGGADAQLRQWDTRTAAQATRAVATRAAVASLELSADGAVLTLAAGREVLWLDPLTLQTVRSFQFASDVNWAGRHPSGTRLVYGGAADFWDHVVDVATGREVEVHKGHHGPVHCVRYAPDGESFASGSEDGTIRLIASGPSPPALPNGAESQSPPPTAASPPAQPKQ